MSSMKKSKNPSLFLIGTIRTVFYSNEIKIVFLDRLVVQYHNNNNKAELQQVFNYLKSNNKTSLSQSELNQIIAEKKKEQLPSINIKPTTYFLGGAMVVAIGVFIYLIN